MELQKRHNTGPELALRRALWRRGFRFRVDLAPIQGFRSKADLVFSRSKVAVYVDGCFWHACPAHATIPKSNRDWWIAKLQSNKRRDVHTNDRLAESGWLAVRVWEHEDVQQAVERISKIVIDHRS